MIGPIGHPSGTNGTHPLDGFAFPVSGGREAGATARRGVGEHDGALPAGVREDVLLLVTELVGNAVVHADVGPDQSLRVELRRWPRRVRVEVVDPGTGLTGIRQGPRSDGSEGVGLFLVDRIADHWGVSQEASGTRVWFEIEFEG